MILSVTPSHLTGTVFIPPSKSHSIRALVLAAFAEEGKPSTITNILASGDIISTIACLEKLGVHFHSFCNSAKENCVTVFPPKEGLKNHIKQLEQPVLIDVANSGTFFYFIGVILCTMGIEFILTGDQSICSRPIKPLTEIYQLLGVKYLGENHAPIRVFGKACTVNEINLEGVFSQPVSGLLLSAPFFKNKVVIKLKAAGELPYLKMTLQWLAAAGINIKVSPDFKCIEIQTGQQVKPLNSIIPADWSSAAFPILAAASSNSTLTLKNLDINDVQGDSRIVEILQMMNLPLTYSMKRKELTIHPHNGKMIGGVFDCGNMPDTVPILAAAACFADGTTVIKNIGICRFKECDRIDAIKTELSKFGAYVEAGQNFLTVHGKTGSNIHCAAVKSLNDHRIAMMLAAAALGAKSTKKAANTVIENFECFKISYPSFIESMRNTGALFKELE